MKEIEVEMIDEKPNEGYLKFLCWGVAWKSIVIAVGIVEISMKSLGIEIERKKVQKINYGGGDGGSG